MLSSCKKIERRPSPNLNTSVLYSELYTDRILLCYGLKWGTGKAEQNFHINDQTKGNSNCGSYNRRAYCWHVNIYCREGASVVLSLTTPSFLLSFLPTSTIEDRNTEATRRRTTCRPCRNWVHMHTKAIKKLIKKMGWEKKSVETFIFLLQNEHVSYQLFALTSWKGLHIQLFVQVDSHKRLLL